MGGELGAASKLRKRGTYVVFLELYLATAEPMAPQEFRKWLCEFRQCFIYLILWEISKRIIFSLTDVHYLHLPLFVFNLTIPDGNICTTYFIPSTFIQCINQKIMTQFLKERYLIENINYYSGLLPSSGNCYGLGEWAGCFHFSYLLAHLSFLPPPFSQQLLSRLPSSPSGVTPGTLSAYSRLFWLLQVWPLTSSINITQKLSEIQSPGPHPRPTESEPASYQGPSVAHGHVKVGEALLQIQSFPIRPH